MRVIDIFDVGVRRHPDRPAFVDGDRSLSYAEAQAASGRIANLLRELGIGEQERVATLGPNCIESVVAQLGIWRAGATWVPLNSRSAIAELVHSLSITETRCVFYHTRYAETVLEVRGAVAADVHWIAMDDEDGSAGLFERVRDLSADCPILGDGPHSMFAMMMTSGTTGLPKAVIMTHLMYETLANAWQAYFPYDVPPVHLCVAPLTHAAGAVMVTLLPSSATNVIMREFDAGEILAAIERHRITTVFLTPTMIYMLLAHPDIRKYDYSSLRYIHYFAAPMAADKLKEAIGVFGPVFAQAFGQTEMVVAATLFTPKEHTEALSSPEHEHRLWSAGRATHVAVVEIMDDDGNILPRGERGEIVCRTNLATPGYHNNPAATAELQAGGWHHTGDIGRIDEDGFVYILDRKKDMIISGGFNVYPNEVEQVLMRHTAIRDCAVVGAPDDKWGEAVVAVIELRDGATVDQMELIADCKARIGSVKSPKRIEIWPSLPRSQNGKVLKREIRAKFWEGRARSI